MTPTLEITCGLVLLALAALLAMCREGPSSHVLRVRLAIVDALASSAGAWFLVSGVAAWLGG